MKLSELFIRLTSTFFFVGYLPLIPGTFGSLAGIALFYLVKDNILAFSLLALGLIILGFLVCGKAEQLIGKKDPKCVVIDEVAGQLLALMCLPYYDTRIIIVGFILFRLFDTLKVFPAGRIQYLKGSLGIMSDDLIAALYTNIILQVVLRSACFKTA